MENWFATWFDSAYYHLLYQHRDDNEAHYFMDQLCTFLQIAPKSKVLDLACGKGRHSVYLAQKGLDVTGLDLSSESIAYAQQYQHEQLRFDTQDMRLPLKQGPYHYIFNLFTSFGYFETEQEHIDTLIAMKNGLANQNSRLVLDFFNAKKAIQQLVLTETKLVQGIEFRLRRYVENGCIHKEIRFSDQTKNYYFREKVRAFTRADFDVLLAAAGLERIHIFGNYSMADFDEKESNRCIILAKIRS
jgi:cyclopropane fatty-acyl-phospholipid synthase-like methyltransferase